MSSPIVLKILPTTLAVNKDLNYSDLKSWRAGAASIRELLRSTKSNKMAIMRFELKMMRITSSFGTAVPG